MDTWPMVRKRLHKILHELWTLNATETKARVFLYGFPLNCYWKKIMQRCSSFLQINGMRFGVWFDSVANNVQSNHFHVYLYNLNLNALLVFLYQRIEPVIIHNTTTHTRSWIRKSNDRNAHKRSLLVATNRKFEIWLSFQSKSFERWAESIKQ